MSKTPILIVEDTVLVGVAVKEMLNDAGYEAVLTVDGKMATEALKARRFEIVLLDLNLPDGDGLALMKKWRKAYTGLHVIIMTAYGDIKKAVECIKAGAFDFLPKPVDKVLLHKTLSLALEQISLSQKINLLTHQQELQQKKEQEQTGDSFIESSPAILQVMKLARRVAANDFSCIFIRGATGTGKSMLAKAIHDVGKRSGQAFIEVNCSALPSNLIESELFGHKRGAFTDAKEDKAGLFELANGGTIFLDEIGDMELALQTKLLHVLESKEFRRIGDSRLIKVDVAVIAATNQDVEQRVADGKFREDLYYPKSRIKRTR